MNAGEKRFSYSIRADNPEELYRIWYKDGPSMRYEEMREGKLESFRAKLEMKGVDKSTEKTSALNKHVLHIEREGTDFGIFDKIQKLAEELWAPGVKSYFTSCGGTYIYNYDHRNLTLTEDGKYITIQVYTDRVNRHLDLTRLYQLLLENGSITN